MAYVSPARGRWRALPAPATRRSFAVDPAFLLSGDTRLRLSGSRRAGARRFSKRADAVSMNTVRSRPRCASCGRKVGKATRPVEAMVLVTRRNSAVPAKLAMMPPAATTNGAHPLYPRAAQERRTRSRAARGRAIWWDKRPRAWPSNTPWTRAACVAVRLRHRFLLGNHASLIRRRCAAHQSGATSVTAHRIQRRQCRSDARTACRCFRGSVHATRRERRRLRQARRPWRCIHPHFSR